ncbi:DoxX family protein [Rickettsiales bacterium]|nr:DoxX family protein [Rickettsiales bacterium]
MSELKTNNKKCLNCLNKFSFIFRIYEFKIALAEKLNFLVYIPIRLLLAFIFFKSGILKLPSGFLGIGKGNWDSTLLLFEYEHPVPFLSPDVAAFLGTSVEIIAPVLLVIGLGTRFAAAALLVMVAVIEFTYQHNIEHFYWASLILVLMFQGAGKLSIDYVIRKKFLACEEYRKISGLS